MGTAERRFAILKKLCRCRYDTIQNLATEFGVSKRTIQRDVEILSSSEPIYTQPGKYGGGVYMVEGYSMDRMYMTDAEINVLQKLYTAMSKNMAFLTFEERELLRYLILQYSKPKSNDKKGKNDERK